MQSKPEIAVCVGITGFDRDGGLKHGFRFHKIANRASANSGKVEQRGVSRSLREKRLRLLKCFFEMTALAKSQSRVRSGLEFEESGHVRVLKIQASILYWADEPNG